LILDPGAFKDNPVLSFGASLFAAGLVIVKVVGKIKQFFCVYKWILLFIMLLPLAEYLPYIFLPDNCNQEIGLL